LNRHSTVIISGSLLSCGTLNASRGKGAPYAIVSLADLCGVLDRLADYNCVAADFALVREVKMGRLPCKATRDIVVVEGCGSPRVAHWLKLAVQSLWTRFGVGPATTHSSIDITALLLAAIRQFLLTLLYERCEEIPTLTLMRSNLRGVGNSWWRFGFVPTIENLHTNVEEKLFCRGP